MDPSPIERVSAKLNNIALDEAHEFKKRHDQEVARKGRDRSEVNVPIKHITINIGCSPYADLTGLENVLVVAQIKLRDLNVVPKFEANALANYAWVKQGIQPQSVTISLTGKSKDAVVEAINGKADEVLAGLDKKELKHCAGSVEISKERVLGLIERLGAVPDWVWEEAQE